ncbi:hypothetical protein CWR43_01940 [Rhizobium sullae]|uniref:Uncharacterized protein n=1 Tax=Rhizobium sullae TaxID=50338 RepID=A0A2N0DEX4_RHISU|nr:hypothetical protein CWR43_01940 [Rhizobium sullae]
MAQRRILVLPEQVVAFVGEEPFERWPQFLYKWVLLGVRIGTNWFSAHIDIVVALIEDVVGNHVKPNRTPAHLSKKLVNDTYVARESLGHRVVDGDPKLRRPVVPTKFACVDIVD